MLKRLDQVAALILLGVGVLHSAVGADVFVAPTERGVWFVSAGFLGVAAALTNLARAADPAPTLLLAIAAFGGAVGALAMGALLLSAGGFRLGTGPETVVLFTAAVSSLFSLRDALRAPFRSKSLT